MIEIGDIIRWGKWNGIYGFVINKTVDIVNIKWFKDVSQGSYGIVSYLVNNNIVVISK